MTGFKKIYLDTSPFIYLLEKNPEFYENVKQFFLDCFKDENELYTSTVTIEEYCIIPYRNNNQKIISDFYKLIQDMDIKIIDVDSQVADKAARIRAEYKSFKGMDSLQLATACETKCEVFLTNDKQLRQFTKIKVITVAELGNNDEYCCEKS